jgi:hypothetical protein
MACRPGRRLEPWLAVIAPLVETVDSLAAALAARGLLRDEAIERIEAAAQRSGLPFSAVAVRLGLVGEWEMAQTLSELCGLPVAAAGDYPPQPVDIGDLNPVFLRERGIAVSARASHPRGETRRSGGGAWAPAIRQQFLYAAGGLRGQPCQHVLEVCVRVMPVELRRVQQAHDRRSALAGP